MSVAGGVLLVLASAAAALWVLDLVRRGRLYVGYGVIFVLLAAFAALLSAPPVRAAVAALLDRLFPGTGALVVGLFLVALLFVYVLTQITVLANRVARLTQELALEKLEEREPPPVPRPPPDAR